MRLILLAITLCLCLGAHAQRFFVVQKLTAPKQVKYVAGDEIGVKVAGDEFILYGEIIAIEDSTVVIDSQRVRISTIEKVYDRSRKKAARVAAITTSASIPFFLFVTTMNNLFNTGDRPLIDDGTWRLTGLFAGVSLALLALPPKKYKIGNKWKVMSLDTSFRP